MSSRSVNFEDLLPLLVKENQTVRSRRKHTALVLTSSKVTENVNRKLKQKKAVDLHHGTFH
jgi:hypothetical protein